MDYVAGDLSLCSTMCSGETRVNNEFINEMFAAYVDARVSCTKHVKLNVVGVTTKKDVSLLARVSITPRQL